jgi:hypothetical protein
MLYAAFDTMAQALQRRESGISGTPSTLTPQTLATARHAEMPLGDTGPGDVGRTGGEPKP